MSFDMPAIVDFLGGSNGQCFSTTHWGIRAHALSNFNERAVWDEGGLIGSLIEQVRARSELTEYERGEYPSGGQRFEQILRFATVDLVKAGWLQKSQGIWSITEAGNRAFVQYPDPETFYKEACRLYSVWKQGRDAVAGTPPPQVDDGDIDIDVEKLSFTFEEAEEQAWSQIEKFLQTSDVRIR